jgi:hypothetical protein
MKVDGSSQMMSTLKPKTVVLVMAAAFFLPGLFAVHDMPREVRPVLGIFLMVTGAIWILLRRRSSRMMMRSRSRVLAFFGEEGVQFFYLAFGVTCSVAGLLSLLAGIV